MKHIRSTSVSLPPPPAGPHTRSASGNVMPVSTSSSAAAVGRLPPPPQVISSIGVGVGGDSSTNMSSSYPSNMARSMTIDEMRLLHQRALQDAEAKRCELRLVLASRYRELVGSSDEVLRMKDRAQELHDLVHALPALMEKIHQTPPPPPAHHHHQQQQLAATTPCSEEKSDSDAVVAATTNHVDDDDDMALRRKLSNLVRIVHRALDRNHVHEATTRLIELFTLIAEKTDEYPLANVLANSSSNKSGTNKSSSHSLDNNTLVICQMRMIFLQVQTLPRKICRISTAQLLQSASYGNALLNAHPAMGAWTSAAALSSLHLLAVDKQQPPPSNQQQQQNQAAMMLLEKYYESKATLLVSLLNQLHASNSDHSAEEILSKIILILQHDVIVHAYEIFIKRNFPAPPSSSSSSGSSNSNHTNQNAASVIVATLPLFDGNVVHARCSKFLQAHLPLIRTKVKSVLISIAGTTASALGKIRQSLYDKTDGEAVMQALNYENPVGTTWDEAVSSMINISQVLGHHHHASADGGSNATAGGGGGGGAVSLNRMGTARFSLWSALFSNTFSSLVHSLLTTAFHSVHSSVVTTLRASLASAPPLHNMLPHEAYRNTLRIATDLDRALLKVGDDSHELLVHAEERVESEKRLRQSLYVQTCEILGRLVCEVRRIAMVSETTSGTVGSTSTSSSAIKELIVGRLCYLLKFRLTSLPKLLDPNSSPAVLQSTSGMISYVDLESAFSLADDNEDGLITLDEALEAVESAFSGTQFHGSEMVRETLLLPTNAGTSSAGGNKTGSSSSSEQTPMNVTLHELTLLTARGLRHETAGPESALGTVQKALDDIVESCFQKWAQSALASPTQSFEDSVNDFAETSSASSESEWQRMYVNLSSDMATTTAVTATSVKPALDAINGVSPHVVGYLLCVSSILNRTTCPSDSLTPVPSVEYAMAMGISEASVPTLTDTLRSNLLRHSLASMVSIFDTATTRHDVAANKCTSAILQLYLDVSFVKYCYFEYNQYGIGSSLDKNNLTAAVNKLHDKVEQLANASCSRAMLLQFPQFAQQKHQHAMEVCSLFVSSLLGSPRAVSGGLDLGSMSGSPAAAAGPFIHAPLTSSRRFALLPIQADRALSDLQLKGKYAKEKEDTGRHKESVGGTYMSSGLGFFSSMLKKK